MSETFLEMLLMVAIFIGMVWFIFKSPKDPESVKKLEQFRRQRSLATKKNPVSTRNSDGKLIIGRKLSPVKSILGGLAGAAVASLLYCSVWGEIVTAIYSDQNASGPIGRPGTSSLLAGIIAFFVLLIPLVFGLFVTEAIVRTGTFQRVSGEDEDFELADGTLLPSFIMLMTTIATCLMFFMLVD